MRQYSNELHSITGFRKFLRERIMREVAASGRDIVILALDGIPDSLARKHWKYANAIVTLNSVVPTTSATAWLSSLTGMDVAEHGVVGAVFRGPDGRIVTLLDEKGPVGIPASGNIFSDATACGYDAIVAVGDWQPFDCSWRDALLHGARRVGGPLFFANREASASSVLVVLRDTIEGILNEIAEQPRLIWCFIDVDQRVHRDGYSPEVIDFLQSVEKLAIAWRDGGAIVLAHSDHGLVPTRHDPAIAALFRRVETRYAAVLGGAGRMRWLHVSPEDCEAARAELAAELPPSIRVCTSEEVFPAGSLAHARAGNIVMIANGEVFVTFGDDCFDHGSLTADELRVPLALWK